MHEEGGNGERRNGDRKQGNRNQADNELLTAEFRGGADGRRKEAGGRRTKEGEDEAGRTGLSSVTTASQVTRRRGRAGGRGGSKGGRVDEEEEHTVQISRVKGRRKRDRDSWEILRPDTIDQSTDKPARCGRRARRQQRQRQRQEAAGSVSRETGPGPVPTPASAQTALEWSSARARS